MSPVLTAAILTRRDRIALPAGGYPSCAGSLTSNDDIDVAAMGRIDTPVASASLRSPKRSS